MLQFKYSLLYPLFPYSKTYIVNQLLFILYFAVLNRDVSLSLLLQMKGENYSQFKPSTFSKSLLASLIVQLQNHSSASRLGFQGNHLHYSIVLKSVGCGPRLTQLKFTYTTDQLLVSTFFGRIGSSRLGFQETLSSWKLKNRIQYWLLK